MKRERVLSKPTKVSDLTFEELYAELNSNWQQKAEALRIRRLRKLRQVMKGDRYLEQRYQPRGGFSNFYRT